MIPLPTRPAIGAAATGKRILIVRAQPHQRIEQSDDGREWFPCEQGPRGFEVRLRLYRLAVLSAPVPGTAAPRT
jgi:hypothetical protein